MKPGRVNLILDSIFYQKVQLWSFLRMRSSKLGKKSRSETVVHLRKVHIQNRTSHVQLCSVECYWHCSDETVHYKSVETVNFCGFRCATKSPITVFIDFVFYINNNKALISFVLDHGVQFKHACYLLLVLK